MRKCEPNLFVFSKNSKRNRSFKAGNVHAQGANEKRKRRLDKSRKKHSKRFNEAVTGLGRNENQLFECSNKFTSMSI